MNDLSSWGVGIAVALLSLLCLVIASRTTDGVIFWTATGLMVFGIAFNYYLVGRPDKRRGD
jgi:hypothetical protein